MGDAAKQPLTAADKERMLAEVDLLIYRLIVDSHVPRSDREDVAQDIRLELLRVAEKYNPNGPARWSTFAHYVAQNVLRRYHGDQPDPAEFTTHVSLDFDRFPGPDLSSGADPEPDPAEAAAGELKDGVAAIGRGMIAAELAAVLGGQHLALVKAIAVHRLSVHQVAEQLGLPEKTVKMNLVNLVRSLAATGKVPADLAARCGLDAAELAAKARRLTPAEQQARRQRVAELAVAGWSRKRIAAELGVSESIVNSNMKAISNARRQRVAELSGHGWSDSRIATELGVHPNSIRKDLAAIRKATKSVAVSA